MGFNRAVVIGAGLIGGSIAGALKGSGEAGSITACDLEHNREVTLNSGWFTDFSSDFREIVPDADLVIICTSVNTIIRLLPDILKKAKPGSIVIDAGSVKRPVMECVSRLSGTEAYFIGGHPMAGKEVSGIEHAESGLLTGCNFFLVPSEDLPEEILAKTEGFVRLLGAVPVRMSAEEHDRIMALVSHFPQILSTLLMNWAAEESSGTRTLDFAGSGFRSMARLSGSRFDVWGDILEKNGDFLQESIDSFANYFNTLKEKLSTGEIQTEFEKANRIYGNILS